MLLMMTMLHLRHQPRQRYYCSARRQQSYPRRRRRQYPSALLRSNSWRQDGEGCLGMGAWVTKDLIGSSQDLADNRGGNASGNNKGAPSRAHFCVAGVAVVVSLHPSASLCRYQY